MEPRDRQALRRQVEAFPRWHYRFDLDGVETPIAIPEHVVRHRERRKWFFDPLVRLCGGSLANRSVLDLGCNAGYWSLAAIEHGCNRVCGIDARPMHIEQAELVFRVKGIDGGHYRFLEGDVLTYPLPALGSFDIALCLGLLYHVNQPVQLLEKVAAVNNDILLIDSTVHPSPEEIFALRFDDLADPRNAVGSPLVLFPSAAAVVAIVRSLGYRGLVLEPRFGDLAGSEDVRQGRRRAFLCARKTDLSPLADLAESQF